MQRCAVAFRRKRAEIHLNAFVAEGDARLVFAAPDHFLSLWMPDELFLRRKRAGTSDQQVEIAHRFAPPAQASGGSDFFDSLAGQVFGQFRRHALGEAQQESAGTLPVVRNRPQNLFFQFRAHPGQLAKFLFAAEAFEVIDRRAAVSLEQKANAFWTKPLNLQKFQGAGRVFFKHFVAALKTASLLDLGQDGGDSFTDPRDIGDLALRVSDDGRDRFRIRFDRSRRIAIGADAEGILARNLHQISSFVKQACNGAVFHN